MRKFVIATSNPGKYQEMVEILEGVPFAIHSSKALNLRDYEVEIGETHEEIAFNKARFYQQQTGLLTLAEDSGIMVDALAGELGIKTRRWGAGEKATDIEWIEYFFKAMKDVPAEKRTARFFCCAALVEENGNSNIFLGVTDGVITLDLEAPITPGIPLSSCFKPLGYDKVYAALSIQEKNRISHRGKAIRSVRDYLEVFLNGA